MKVLRRNVRLRVNSEIYCGIKDNFLFAQHARLYVLTATTCKDMLILT